MKSKRKYTLFLRYNQRLDNYYPVGLLYGKIPFDEKEAKFYGEYERPHITKVIDEYRRCKNLQ